MPDHPVPVQAADLSPEEAEARAQLCYGIQQRIITSVRAGREALWSLAEALYDFDEASGWSALGYEKLGDWLADPEISMTYRTYRRYVDTWRETAVRRKVDLPTLAEVDMTKVDIVLPAVKSGRTTIESALDDARVMGARDLRETYLGRKETETAADNGAAPRDEAGDVIDYTPPPVNDGTDRPQRASEVPIVEAPPTEEPEPAQKPPEPSGPLPEDVPQLTKQDFLLIYQGLQGWENKSRFTPCPRTEVRATMKKLKAIIKAYG